MQNVPVSPRLRQTWQSLEFGGQSNDHCGISHLSYSLLFRRKHQKHAYFTDFESKVKLSAV